MNATTTVVENFTENGNLSVALNSTDFGRPGGPASLEALILLTVLFFLVGFTGITGNGLVIFVVLSDRKMRSSVTNLFIMNLAVADSLIMLFGVPEIVQFILNRGWLLGRTVCKFDRFLLVVSLYASVLTLLAVCVERFIAIVHPIKAHLLCGKRKVVFTIGCIWPVAVCCGLPTVLFIDLRRHSDLVFCTLQFPPDWLTNTLIFKYSEFALYYLTPVCVQVALYLVIARRLFASAEELHTRFQMRSDNMRKSERSHEAVKARRGVVKMLVASVLIYIISYLPPQILLFYNTFSQRRFRETWSYLVFVNVVAYVNSAANPVLYSIFSQNFRKKFHSCLCCLCAKIGGNSYRRQRSDSFESRGTSRRISSMKTTTSKL